MLSVHVLNPSDVGVFTTQEPLQFENVLLLEFPARITAARAPEPNKTSPAARTAIANRVLDTAPLAVLAVGEGSPVMCVTSRAFVG
jgi:hypothetical protein